MPMRPTSGVRTVMTMIMAITIIITRSTATLILTEAAHLAPDRPTDYERRLHRHSSTRRG